VIWSNHPVPDRWYRKGADFAPILRYRLPPGQERLIATPDQFIPPLREQSLHPSRRDGREGDPVYARRAIVLFGHFIRCMQGLYLIDMDV
jgi:hypothetical protein